jgi:hypothetical protein
VGGHLENTFSLNIFKIRRLLRDRYAAAFFMECYKPGLLLSGSLAKLILITKNNFDYKKGIKSKKPVLRYRLQK